MGEHKSRTHKRRQAKKAKRKEMIPGVPSFEHGGGILDLNAGGSNAASDINAAATNSSAFPALSSNLGFAGTNSTGKGVLISALARNYL